MTHVSGLLHFLCLSLEWVIEVIIWGQFKPKTKFLLHFTGVIEVPPFISLGNRQQSIMKAKIKESDVMISADKFLCSLEKRKGVAEKEFTIFLQHCPEGRCSDS